MLVIDSTRLGGSENNHSINTAAGTFYSPSSPSLLVLEFIVNNLLCIFRLFILFFPNCIVLWAVKLKKGDMTVIRNFENAIVLKVKIVKKPKVEVASYNNLKETSSKIQGASYNWENTVIYKFGVLILAQLL